jgi:uncharacterized membrane protein
MGWLLSVVAIATVFVIDAPRAIAILFIAGLVIGIVVSVGYYRAFAEPRNYTERALMTLAVVCTINGHLAVLLYGAYTAAPLMIVIGIHFVARTEAERVARWIFASAVVSYTAISIAIICGAVADPGVFASDRPVSPATLATGSCFVLATFWLAYHTARQFRLASLAAIDDLQRATRLASQREALMDELRGDLERALRAGPGRYSDHTVGRFRLGAVLGRGAMGEVYVAQHTTHGTAAAVNKPFDEGLKFERDLFTHLHRGRNTIRRRGNSNQMHSCSAPRSRTSNSRTNSSNCWTSPCQRPSRPQSLMRQLSTSSPASPTRWPSPAARAVPPAASRRPTSGTPAALSCGTHARKHQPAPDDDLLRPPLWISHPRPGRPWVVPTARGSSC